MTAPSNADLEKRLEQILWSYEDNLHLPELIEQAKTEILTAIKDAGYSNTPYGTGEFSFTEKATKEGYMTGQEWYDRFWSIYNEDRLPAVVDATIIRQQVDAVAKRAAGIDT